MTFYLYKNLSDDRTMNKQLQLYGTFEGVIKDPLNEVEPILTVAVSDKVTLTMDNVDYVGGFMGPNYYYITDITALPGNLLEIKCKRDAKMSFRNAIMNAIGQVARSTNMSNPLLVDEKIKTLVDVQVDTYTFPNDFENDYEYILTVST